MEVFAKTDIGRERELNEDYYYIPDKKSDIQIYILADGMGGYNGGEIASKLATTSVKTYIEKNIKEIAHEDKENIVELLKNAIEYANKTVYKKSKENKELEGMGTTLEVCLIYNNRVYIGHIGDSRVYRMRKTVIQKITQDHSYVQKLVKDGTITKEEAVNHPRKNMLMKALGCEETVEPDIIVKSILEEDIIVMTSDGLTNLITDEEI